MPRHRARACWHIAHKRTALPQTEGLFIGAFEKLSCGYPTITLNLLRVDTFSSSFPRRHKEFRLVATTNLFGDILSDQASGLAGGVGLAPSLNAGSDHAMAQAVHGTAPDIAGKGLANPAALILSTAQLLLTSGLSTCSQPTQVLRNLPSRPDAEMDSCCLMPLRPGARPRMFTKGRSPVGGGSAGHVKMAET